ncbi:MAG: hypothetical protein IMZ46_02190 [Acidobacteria bacterium]|nr:hypothetical protein [Acidobacteriota bacterium]
MPVSPIYDKGPVELVWGYGESDAAYLGKTLGAVKVTMVSKASDINEDQAGDAAVDAVLTGSTFEITVPLTRLSRRQLARVLNTVASGCIIPIENQVGCSLYALAKQLVIKPLCGNMISAEPCRWIHLFKTYPIAGLDLTFDKETQRTFPVTFKVFVSQDSGYVGQFGTIGMDSGASAL